MPTHPLTDLTVVYLTANALPAAFSAYQQQTLRAAIGPAAMIVVSRQPIAFHGDVNLIDREPKSPSNIYAQLLRAATLATTPFIAVAEDDTLYHSNHFTFYRPAPDTFAYNQNRFALFSWGEPIYSWRNRKSNCSLIAPTALLIDALTERFTKWPQGTPAQSTGEVGRPLVERALGLTPRKAVEVFGDISIIQVNHESATEDRQRRHRKRFGPIKARDLYHWGPASALRRQLGIGEAVAA